MLDAAQYLPSKSDSPKLIKVQNGTLSQLSSPHHPWGQVALEDAETWLPVA